MLNTFLDTFQKNHAWRKREVIQYRAGVNIVCNGKSYINFTSNDYLNLSQHTEVKNSFCKAAKYYGLGSGASALVSGFHHSHSALEAAFSDFLGQQALLFNSGYHANLAVFQAIANRQTIIMSDKYCHASLLDGIHLSRAKHRRFRHQDLTALSNILNQNETSQKIVVTESIFSMEGSLTELSNFATLCHDNNALFFVDDAHGLGLLGENGRGAMEHFKLSTNSIFCLIQPLGKALGSMGAVVSGNSVYIEMLIQKSGPYRYSTALPPAIASGTLTALKCLQKEPWRRTQLKENILLFNLLAKQYQIPLLSWDITPIRSVLIGTNKKTLQCQEFLRKQGYFVSCIRPPTVPENTARLRISLCSELTKENINHLLQYLVEFLGEK